MPDGISVVKRLSSEDLTRWRSGKDLAVSDIAVGTAETAAATVDKPAWRAPLDGPDTMAELLGEWWGNMTRDRRSYQRAIRWLRLKVPGAVSHLTDADLLEYLNGLARDAAKKNESGQGRPSRDLGLGRYTAR